MLKYSFIDRLHLKVTLHIVYDVVEIVISEKNNNYMILS